MNYLIIFMFYKFYLFLREIYLSLKYIYDLSLKRIYN